MIAIMVTEISCRPCTTPEESTARSLTTVQTLNFDTGAVSLSKSKMAQLFGSFKTEVLEQKATD